MKTKRIFQIESGLSADQLLEVLKYHYPPGTVSVQTKYFLEIICDREGSNKNLIAPNIQVLLNENGAPNAKVSFENQCDIKPEIPLDTLVTYYIESMTKGRDRPQVLVYCATQKMLETGDWNDDEQVEILEQMLEKADLPVSDGASGEYWWEATKKELPLF